MADSEHLNFRSVSRGAWISPETEEVCRNGSENGTVSGEGQTVPPMVGLYAADNPLHPRPPRTGL